MKIVKVIVFIAALVLATTLTSRFSGTAYGQTAASIRLSPNALVADLYREHNRKHSPFFQTRSRALLYKYFEKGLADMIWKDAVTSKGEVGALDGDPLYDAQDTDIKKFVIGKPTYEAGKAKVGVTFTNLGQPKSFIFTLVNGRSGWRINNIEYGEGRSLRGYLKR
jgi:hypothetical protein